MPLEKKPEELWTSYIARRLKEEVNVDFDNKRYEFFSRSVDTAAVRLNISSKSGKRIELERMLWVDDLADLFDTRALVQVAPDFCLKITEQATITDNDSHDVTFSFEGGRVESIMLDSSDGWKTYLTEETNLDPLPVVNDIISYAHELAPDGLQVTAPQKSKQHAPGAARESILEQKLEEMHKVLRRLDATTQEHPIILKSDHAYLTDLYTTAVNKNIRNLRTFAHGKKTIPYVLVTSKQLGGTAGRASDNLYFVARDKAPETWQQNIIAYHESLCIKFGHENAKRRELTLAKSLGKEEAYVAWRKQIDVTCPPV